MMATCDLGYDHEDPAPDPAPDPVTVADPGPNENDVQIAEIEAAASIEREKIWTEQQEIALAGENEKLRGEIAGMREILDRLQPPEPADPEPVVIPVPAAPADPPETVPAPPETSGNSGGGKKPKGWFSSYG
jgi:hypothetical protein